MLSNDSSSESKRDEEEVNQAEAVAPYLPQPSEIDALLTEELNQLSLIDREKVMEEIHGVHSGKAKLAEEESRIITSLEEVQNQLDTIRDERLKEGYNEATRLESSYILDRAFRLMFIRAEQYDCRKAAVRILHFLNYIREGFGDSVLTRPIQWTDLGPVLVSILEEGSFQVLPARDSVGRRILVVLNDAGMEFPVVYRFYASIYLFQCLAEDELTQRLGFVLVFFFHNIDGTVLPDVEVRNSLQRIHKAIPIRCSAAHWCFPDTPFCHLLRSAHLLAAGREYRSRSRFHVGALTECLYSLKGFGIPIKLLPDNLVISSQGGIQNHLKWCAMRRAKERLITINASLAQGIVECPHREDYLFGKGQAVMKHQGNVAMRNMLKERIERWEEAAFKDKSGITWEIVNEFVHGGGRFLKEVPDGWYTEVDLEAARQKVSIALRDMAKRVRKQRQQSVNATNQEVAAPSEARGPSVLLNETSQKRRRLSGGDGSGCGNGAFCGTSKRHMD